MKDKAKIIIDGRKLSPSTIIYLASKGVKIIDKKEIRNHGDPNFRKTV